MSALVGNKDCIHHLHSKLHSSHASNQHTSIASMICNLFQEQEHLTEVMVEVTAMEAVAEDTNECKLRATKNYFDRG